MFKQVSFAALLAVASQVSAVKVSQLEIEPVAIEPVAMEVAPVAAEPVTTTTEQAATTLNAVTAQLPSFMTAQKVSMEDLQNQPSWSTDSSNGFVTLPRMN